MSDMLGFHRGFYENYNDTTPALVYADMVEEGGQPAFASLIRRHAERYRKGVLIDHADHDIGYSPWYRTEPGEARVVFAHHADHDNQVWVAQRSLVNRNHSFKWGSGGLTNDEAADLLHGLHAEGVKLGQGAKTWLDHVGKPLPSPDRLARAYRTARTR